MDTGTKQQGWLTVNPGELLRLRDAAGRHLTVVQGTVWITQDGDPRDPVLESGASFRFDRNGLSLVKSLGGPAMVVLEEGLTPEDHARRRAGPVRFGGHTRNCAHCELQVNQGSPVPLP